MTQIQALGMLIYLSLALLAGFIGYSLGNRR